MADGVLSMFMTPEQYQLMQNTAQQQRAAQFASMDPMQQAQYGLFLGGSQLGGAIGRGLGGEDRQLKLISQRQALSQNIDPSNPESILQVAQEASRLGDQPFALSLSEFARSAATEIARAKQLNEDRRNVASDIQVAKYRGELLTNIEALKDATDPESVARRQAFQRQLDSLPTKAGDSTNDIKNAEAFALQKGARGTPEFNREFANQLERLTTKADKDLTFGAERESKSFEKYDKPFRELTQAEKAVVNKLLEEEGKSKASAGAAKLVMPGDKKLEDIPQYRRNVQMTIEPQSKAVNAADQALSALDESMKSGNFASWRAAQTQFARAISGTGDLSQKELKAAGADPSLIGGSADYISTLFTSTPTLETQKSVQKTLQAIKTVAAKKARDEIERQRRLGERAGYKPDDISAALDFPEFTAPAAAGGGKKTTSWNDLPTQPKSK
jgi:hypothetical protein